MTPPLDMLLAEGTLTFKPLSGTFDIQAVSSAIEGIGAAYHDAADPTVYALFLDPEAREACRAARAADPNETFPFVPLLTVRPEQIMLFTDGSDVDLKVLAGQFITWLTSAYDCRIVNEFNTDMETIAALSDKPSA